MVKAVRPFGGRVIVSQGKHNSIIAGKLVGGAIDFIQSNFMRLMGRTACYMPLKAEVIQIITKIPQKRDGVVLYRTEDGKKHLMVHVIPNPKLKVGLWYKQGTKTGTLDPHPVYATGKHWHHAIMTNKNRPVDMMKWYANNGLKNWYQDPSGLLK